MKRHFGLAAAAALLLTGCTTAAPEYVDQTLPNRTIRFPGANYSALAVRDGLAVTSSHWSREDCGGVFDISNPTNIRFLLRYPCRGYSCADPVFFGDRCYVPNMFSISVLNVKDRNKPKYEGVINPLFPEHGGDLLWVTNNTLYFKGRNQVYKMRPDGLTYDKVDGVVPPKAKSTKTLTDDHGRKVSILGGALTVDGNEMPFAYDLSSLAVFNRMAWVFVPAGAVDAALIPIDAAEQWYRTAKRHPRVKAEKIAYTNCFQTMGMQTASCVTRAGNLLFADDGIARLGRDGEATFIRPRTHAVADTSVDGKRIAQAMCFCCRVVDFSDLKNIRTTDFAPPADKPLHVTGCVLEGKRLYLCYTLKEAKNMDFIYRQPTRGFVAAYDTDDPSKPLSVIETGVCIAMAKAGGYLYVTGKDGNFMIVDARDAAKLRLADVRDDIQLGGAWKVKRFGEFVYVLNGGRVIELDVADPAHPQVKRLFYRGYGTDAPGYDDFTVEDGRLYALAHASIDVFPLKGQPLDRVANDCGVRGIGQPLKEVDASIFAGHVARPAKPAWLQFQCGRFGHACGAYPYDWVRLRDGNWAVAYGEGSVVICNRMGRFLRELPRGADGWIPVFAKAVLEKDGCVYVQDDAGKAYLAFPDVYAGRRDMKGSWCSLGTSITWYNDNVLNSPGNLTRGYQARVLDRLLFTSFDNCGISGGRVGDQWMHGTKYDYYTVEHGINDWGRLTPVGTMDDYLNNAKNGTFYANYRILVDRIRAANPAAKVILCTPRKAYGFGSYLPKTCDGAQAKNGVRLVQYADAVRAIAAHEKFPVADFYATCGEQEELAGLSIDTALHPNDPGFQRMADELVRAFGELP